MPFLFSLFGLAIGSFINALVYRFHEGLSLWERSLCPGCHKKIRWYDNIPLLSYVLLRGRCRACQGKISWRYPIVEFVTALLFGAVGAVLFSPAQPATWLETGYLLSIFTLLLAIAAYDFVYYEIPIAFVILGSLVTLAYLSWVSQFAVFVWDSPLSLGIAGGVALAFFLFLLVFFSQETWMGWGDVWIGFLAGVIVGLPNILWLLTLASFLGAIVGIAGILLKQKKLKSALPFAPFLVTGTILLVFVERIAPELLPVLPFFFR